MKLALSEPSAEVEASVFPDLLTISMDLIPEKVPSAAKVPFIVAEHWLKLTVPKLANFVMLPPIEGLSAMHSADDLCAPAAAPLVKNVFPVVVSVMLRLNVPAEGEYEIVAVNVSPGFTDIDGIVTEAAGYNSYQAE